MNDLKSICEEYSEEIISNSLNKLIYKRTRFINEPNIIYINQVQHKFSNYITNQTKYEREKAINDYCLELMHNLGIGNIDDLNQEQTKNYVFNF
jgi:hypothetical protein